MYYLCEKYYKPNTVQYYIANCVSWVPRLTLLDLTKQPDLRTRSQNRTHSYVGDLLYWVVITVKREALGFPGGALVKNPPANAGDTDSIPGPGRSHMPRSN